MAKKPESQITKKIIENWPQKICFVCGQKNISDKHHIVPVEYGGPETGLTVPLCPTDHRRVHREAENIVRNGEKGKYINSKLYPIQDHFKRAQFISSYIVMAKNKFIATGNKKAEGARNMAQISFSATELSIAHDLKKQLGFKSLSRMIKFLVLEKWKQNNIK